MPMMAYQKQKERIKNMEIKTFTDAKMELNSACDTFEDIFGDYEEIADAMARINSVIDFLWKKEQEEMKKGGK